MDNQFGCPEEQIKRCEDLIKQGGKDWTGSADFDFPTSTDCDFLDLKDRTRLATLYPVVSGESSSPVHEESLCGDYYGGCMTMVEFACQDWFEKWVKENVSEEVAEKMILQFERRAGK